jgi:hypothetical protein
MKTQQIEIEGKERTMKITSTGSYVMIKGKKVKVAYRVNEKRWVTK